MTADVIATLTFDEALGQLQGVVGELEAGNLPLETAIAAFERGVALHDHCARLLDEAELRVQRLTESSGGSLRLVDVGPDEPPPDEPPPYEPPPDVPQDEDPAGA